MITGFNTDVEHDGTVYHVQTEDKGLDTPFILSLVYVGGAILASKRSPYEDLVATGFNDAALAERLQRQHKLICAAISAGRIDDLKRLSQREPSEKSAPVNAPPPAAVAPPAVEPLLDAPVGMVVTPQEPPAEPAAAQDRADAAGANNQNGRSVLAMPDLIPVELDDALHVDLLEEKDFRAGEIVTLRARVSRGAFGQRSPLRHAAVTVKVLGTEFRPLILTAKTDEDGLAVVHVWLPRFTKGRAAILVRAVADGFTAELRRVVHHG